MLKNLNKIIRIITTQGLQTLINRIETALPIRIKQLKLVILTLYKWNKINISIKEIIDTANCDFIDIMDVSFGWTLNLFQRPQHMAQQLAEQNVLIFYGMNILESDKMTYPVHKLKKNLYILDLMNPIVRNILQHAISISSIKSVYHVYSTNTQYSYNNLLRNQNKHLIVYEYIDSIKLSKDTMVQKRHYKILNDNKICMVVTADKLREEVTEAKHKNYIMVTNGTDFNHWYNLTRKDCPQIMEPFMSKEKIIIGYYGALTHDWFDYELITKIAKQNRKYLICLIGPFNYIGPSRESSKKYLDALKTLDNVLLIDTVAYMELPMYAKYFDICIIPFKINDITLCTSPVKLFEYLAMGKPIVTTKMPECYKYNTVKVAENHEHFINLIEKCINLIKNDEFSLKQIEIARQNSWCFKSLEYKKYIISRL